MARAGAGKLQFLGVVDTSDASHNRRYGSRKVRYVAPYLPLLGVQLVFRPKRLKH